MACACKNLDCKLGGSPHTPRSTAPRDHAMADHQLAMAQAPTTPDTQPAPVVPLRSTLAAAAWRTAETDNERERERVKQTASAELKRGQHVCSRPQFVLFI